ncbi:hypothetical protein, partial [Mesorhizobium japonicum]|uniref:hypothetical protein n=1 Tax=Mesorhizobium japonicum TaxID=2066070 RepID=UPI003B592575
MMPQGWHDKVSYRIEGAGGACSLILNRGVNLQLQSPSLQQCRWNLVAAWATERDVRIDVGGVLSVGGVKVTFGGRVRHEVIRQLTWRQSFKVNRSDGRLDIIEQSAPAGENEQSLL